MKDERIESIDIFRGIGIIIMVMGHIGFGETFDYWIHAFHMPMFYFVSGLFFKADRVDETKIIDYAKKKARTLLIPYVFFAILHYLIWLKWNWTNAEADLYEPLTYIFGVNTYWLPIAGALWFLSSLFFTEMIYFVMMKAIKNKVAFHILITILAVVGNLELKIFSVQLPLAIGPALVGLGFFDIAQLLFVNKNILFARRLLNMSTIKELAFGLITNVLIFLNGCVSMRTSEYANIVLFWINAVSSIIIGLRFSMWVDLKLQGRFKRVITFIGRNSIVYVCLNQLTIACIYTFILYNDSYRILGLTLTLILLGMCSFIVNKTLLRKIIGR